MRLAPAARDIVHLRLAFDGETTVDLPMADFFFARADDAMPARSVLAGVDGDWLYAWWPMPFAQSARVELVIDADAGAAVVVDSELRFDPDAPVPDAAGRFFAARREACSGQGDAMLHSAQGAGKLVAVSARYSGVDGAILEGDERVQIDGMSAPSWYGTGVEDFYNGGFYFDRGPIVGPLAGVTAVSVVSGEVAVSAHRLLLTDPVVHAASVRFRQELGATPASPAADGCVDATVFGYRGRAQSVSYGRFELGDAAAVAAHAYVAPDGADCDVVAS
jgi:hypothetical protein